MLWNETPPVFPPLGSRGSKVAVKLALSKLVKRIPLNRASKVALQLALTKLVKHALINYQFDIFLFHSHQLSRDDVIGTS